MSSGFTTKEWKQRISEFATRRLLSIVSQSSGNMTVDVSRAEGLVSQVGDAFSPENMNGLEQRIANAFANVDADVEAAKKSASDGKILIAAAITAKNVAASASDTFAVLAQKIGQIVLGSGNATRADVLSGKTFTNDDGVQYTGSMPNNGSYGFSGVNTTGSGGAGYYSGITVDTRPSYNEGYAAGKDAPVLKIVTLWDGRLGAPGAATQNVSLDVKNTIPNYSELTVDNFFLDASNVTAHDDFHDQNFSRSYNANTGMFYASSSPGGDYAVFALIKIKCAYIER